MEGNQYFKSFVKLEDERFTKDLHEEQKAFDNYIVDDSKTIYASNSYNEGMYDRVIVEREHNVVVYSGYEDKAIHSYLMKMIYALIVANIVVILLGFVNTELNPEVKKIGIFALVIWTALSIGAMLASNSNKQTICGYIIFPLAISNAIGAGCIYGYIGFKTLPAVFIVMLAMYIGMALYTNMSQNEMMLRPLLIALLIIGEIIIFLLNNMIGCDTLIEAGFNMIIVGVVAIVSAVDFKYYKGLIYGCDKEEINGIAAVGAAHTYGDFLVKFLGFIIELLSK